MFLGYWIEDFHFDSPNPKNLVFQSIRGRKVLKWRILIIGNLILILFLHTALFRFVRSVSQVSVVSD